MAYLTTEIGPTKGFHPVSSTTIHLPSPYRHYDQCSLYLYHTFPPLLFVDTHELAQRNESYRFKHWGSRDLEKPVHALPDEISELLVDVRLLLLPPALLESEGNGNGVVNPNANAKTEMGEDEGRDVHVDVPMHMRYGSPKSPSSSDPDQKLYERIRVDWPLGFLSCPLTSPLKQPKTSIYLSLPPHILSTLPSQTDHILIPIPPHSNFSSSQTFTDLYLPLGNTNDLAFVEPLTALTILACCFWVFRIAFKILTRLNNQTSRPKTS